MKNQKYYRIKKVEDGYNTNFYPQKRFLGIWWNIFAMEPYSDGGFLSFEKAQRRLCEHLVPTKVEYLPVNCGDTSETAHRTPNPPPSVQ